MKNTLAENITRPEGDPKEEIPRTSERLDLVTLVSADGTPSPSKAANTAEWLPKVFISSKFDVSAESEKTAETPAPTERKAQAERLTPTAEKINQVINELGSKKQMQDAGLVTNATTLHENLIKQMVDDKALTDEQMKKMKSFPVGAGYVASGAITSEQLKIVLKEQSNLRDAGKPKNETDLGHILRTHQEFDQTKIDLADSMISALKGPENSVKP